MSQQLSVVSYQKKLLLRDALQKQVLLVFFVAVFIFPSIASGEVSKFVFPTDSQTIKPGVVSEKITISAQDSSGNPADVPQTACVNLKTTSSSGVFSSSNTNWSAIDKLTMSKNSANRSFYYKDSAVGSYTLTAQVALRPDTVTDACTKWPLEEWNIKWTATQNINISNSNAPVAESVAGTPPAEPGADSGSSNDWPIEPQIYVSAGPDKNVTAGAEEKFSGQALGLKKEPLDGARYIWSFGDGSRGEGQNVLHTYKYPGEYIVMLDVVSGKYTAIDRLVAKVVPNSLKISGVNNDFAQIINSSNSEINVSNWFIRSDGKNFKIPETTLIKAGGNIAIPNSISGLKTGFNIPLELLYPNGSLAYFYNGQKETANQNESEINKLSAPTTKTVSKSVRNTEPTDGNINIGAQKNMAGVIYTSNPESRGLPGWLVSTLGLGVLCAGGYIFLRRQKQKSLQESDLSKEFSIDENGF